MRLLDVGLAGSALALGWPILFGAATASAIFVGFPPWYVSRRVGLAGRDFRHIKLRSMFGHSGVGRVFFEQHRIGRVGRVLRRTHLDELPELWSILTGDMSLVGPRPLPRELLVGLGTAKRERVRPGWTGLAQLELLRRGRLGKQEQLGLDELYVDTRSTLLNLQILARTAWRGFRPAPLDLDPEGSEDRRRFGASLRKRT
jgi:lipopolysaccharide/colanic/teichoic acid biosynthesis glycosyltransferase